MSLPHTDERTVLAAQQGQDRAWDDLISQWLPTVLAWCTRLGGPRVDPEDAAHDVFVIAMDKIHALRDPARFSSWLVGITRRVLAAHRRRAWLRRWVPGDPDLLREREGRQREVEMSDAARLVQRALEKLSPRQREILVLVDLEERTAAEVAHLLAIPEGTVKSRLRRGRLLLRAEFERLERASAMAGALEGYLP